MPRHAASLVLIVLLAGTVMAAVPQTIVYQGRLTTSTGEPVADGLYHIRIRIYDAPVGGLIIWDNGPRSVSVTGGLFTYYLGDSVALPAYLFDDTARWLGIRAESDEELLPRVKMASVPYAYRAHRADSAAVADTAVLAGNVIADPYVDEIGDTMRGDLLFQDPANTYDLAKLELAFYNTAGNFMLYDKDVPGHNTAKLWGQDWGELELHDGYGDLAADLSATAGTGGRLDLMDPLYGGGITLLGGGTGDAAVQLQDGAINELEQVNEPGLAASYKDAYTVNYSMLESAADSVAINAPTAGFVYVVATAYFFTRSPLGGYRMIASISTVRNQLNIYSRVEAKADYAANEHYIPFSITRVQAVTSGITTFYLTTKISGGLDEFEIRKLRLTAMFFPTAYGAVVPTAVAADAPDVPEESDVRATVEAMRAAEVEAQKKLMEAKVQGPGRKEPKK